MMKKLSLKSVLAGVLIGTLLTSGVTYTATTIGKSVYDSSKVTFLGKTVTLKEAPVAITKQGSKTSTVYVPLKETLEAVGMKVTYDAKTKTYAVTPSMMKGGGMPSGMTSTTETSSIKTKWMDVAYASKSSAQKLDIYLPNNGSGPFPVLVFIHGGAFKSGDKSGELNALSAALERGYAVASINYRLSGEAKFPAQINDVKAAIRFIRANASTYKLDGSKMATWGGSAGGNLAALAGTSGGVKSLQDDTLGNANVSDSVQATVDWFGPINFATMDAEFKALGQTPAMGATSVATSPESVYIGKTVGSAEADALVKQANPQTYMSKDDPAFYIQHGTADRNIPITQSINFSKALKAVIGTSNVTYETIEGAGHGGSQFNSAENLKKILDFLDKQLK